MGPLIFSHLARVFLLFLIALHGVMLFFLLQGNAKEQVRQAIFAALDRDQATLESAAPATKKPKIPLLISAPALPSQAFYSGQLIRLESNKPVAWEVDQTALGVGRNVLWQATAGRHVIQARQQEDLQHLILEVQ